MKIARVGGGPGGLYFAISAKPRDPSHDIVVLERNRPDDTFGWGVVLSDPIEDNPRGRLIEPGEVASLPRHLDKVNGSVDTNTHNQEGDFHEYERT